MIEISRIFNEKITPRRILRFGEDIWHEGKARELLSFLWWEVRYKAPLLQPLPTLRWSDRAPAAILGAGGERPVVRTDHFTFGPSPRRWMLTFCGPDRHRWACRHTDRQVLQRIGPDGEPRAAFRFGGRIQSLFVSSENRAFACVNGKVFRSTDGGKTFEVVLTLSHPKAFFRFDSIVETPGGDILLGEYGNVKRGRQWQFIGFIYHSRDGGETWERLDFLQKAGINKHVHLLKWCRRLGGLVLTDGDNQKNIWINTSGGQWAAPATSSRKGWEKVNASHREKGGYTGFVELADRALLATDYNGGTNFMVSTPDMRTFRARVIPDPYRRSWCNGMALRKNRAGATEIWASLLFKNSRRHKSLIMMSADQGATWARVLEYDGTRFEIKPASDATGIAGELYFLSKDRREKKLATWRVHG